MTVHEPDAYHPDLIDDLNTDYPNRVVLAWGFVDGDDNEMFRRQVYWLAPNGNPEAALGEAPGTSVKYAYASDQSNVACYFSNVLWLRDEFPDGEDIFSLPNMSTKGGTAATVTDQNGAPVEAVAVNMGFDFIPIVHTPNSLSNAHFGRSMLARPAQVLDDIAKTDADLQYATELAGRPPIGIGGVQSTTDLTVSPGAVYGLGDKGKMDVLDTSGAVTALLAVADYLGDRLSVAAQVPNGLLGRVDASEVPSGVTLSLSFTPFVQLVQKSRGVRHAKHPLGLRMVQRIAAVNKALDGPALPARIAYGSFMPEDRSAIVSVVVQLLAAKAISKTTALTLLAEAGITAEDVTAELAAIRAEDPAGARDVADATGSEAMAAAWMSLTVPEPVEETTPPGTVDQPTPIL